MHLSFKPNVTCRPTPKLVVCERFLNVQTSKQRGKKLTVDRGPSGSEGGYHGTTGTMVNPALFEV